MEVSKAVLISAVVALCLSVPGAALTGGNIRNHIIDLDESETYLSRSGPLVRQSTDETFPATTATSGGIKRVRAGYAKIGRTGGGVKFPGVVGLEFEGFFSGNIRLRGYLVEWVDSATDRLASKYDNNFRKSYRAEKQNLQSRAGGGFFGFFQAAARYGYTKNKETEDFVNSGDFKGLSNRTRTVFTNIEQEDLVADFRGKVKYITNGKAGLFSIFGYVFVTQIYLDSGKIYNVIKKNPELTLTDPEGNIVDQESKPVNVTRVQKPGRSIKDFEIDVAVADGR